MKKLGLARVLFLQVVTIVTVLGGYATPAAAVPLANLYSSCSTSARVSRRLWPIT